MGWEDHLKLGSFWRLLVEQILITSDGNTLSLKKMRSKLLKRASARLGKDAQDEGLAGLVDKYLTKARATGELLFEGKHVQLPPHDSAQQQCTTERAQPAAADGNRGGEAGPFGREQAPPQKHAPPRKASSRAGSSSGKDGTGTKAGVKRKKYGNTEAGEAAELPHAQAAASEGRPSTKKRRKRDKVEAHAAATDDAGAQEHDAGAEQPGAPESSVLAAKGSVQMKKKKGEVQAERELQAEDPGLCSGAAADAGQPCKASGAAQKSCPPGAAPRQGGGLAGALAALVAAQVSGQKAQAQGQAAEVGPAKAPRRASRRIRTGAAPIADGDEEPWTWRMDKKRSDVKTGYFSKAELQAIREGVEEFARTHGFSTDDTAWLFATRTSSSAEKATARGAWTAIAKKLPHRRVKAVWAAGTRMLHEGNFQGRWSAEEEAKLLELAAQKPGRWAEIGTALGRLPEGARDKHRLLTGIAAGARKGRWDAAEEARLVDLVEAFLAKRQEHEKAAGVNHEVGERVVLDDISWDTIALQHGSRSEDQCKLKWYTSLSPSMVSRGDWGPGDDRRMLKALVQSGAAHEWEVDWGGLVPQRSAQHAKRRWRLMLKCVPEHTEKEFDQILEFLVATYTPELRSKAAGESGDGDEGDQECRGDEDE